MTSELQPLTENEYGAVGRISYFDGELYIDGTGGFIEGGDGNYYFLTASHLVDNLENVTDDEQLIYSQDVGGLPVFATLFDDGDVFIYPDDIYDIAIIRLDFPDQNLKPENFFSLSLNSFDDNNNQDISLNFYLGLVNREGDPFLKFSTTNYQEIHSPKGYTVSDAPIMEGDSGGLVTFTENDKEYINGIISRLGHSANEGFASMFTEDVLKFINDITDGDGKYPEYNIPQNYKYSSPKLVDDHQLKLDLEAEEADQNYLDSLKEVEKAEQDYLDSLQKVEEAKQDYLDSLQKVEEAEQDYLDNLQKVEEINNQIKRDNIVYGASFVAIGAIITYLVYLYKKIS